EFRNYPQHVLDRFPELEEFDLSHRDKTLGAYPSYDMNGGSPLCNGKFHWESYVRGDNDAVAECVYCTRAPRRIRNQHGIVLDHEDAGQLAAGCSNFREHMFNRYSIALRTHECRPCDVNPDDLMFDW